MAGIPLNTFKTFVKNVQRPNKVNDQGYYILDQYYFTSINGVLVYPPGPTELGNSSFLAYTAPLGVTSVVLYAHVATTSEFPRSISMWHYRPKLHPVAFTQLLNEIVVPNNDALVAISGKLVLETGDALYISSSNAEIVTAVAADISKSQTDVKLTLSILETANQ